MRLFKTTLVIWSDYDPSTVEIEDLARDATSGDAYCSRQVAEEIEDVKADPDWDGTEFFDGELDEDDEDEIAEAGR